MTIFQRAWFCSLYVANVLCENLHWGCRYEMGCNMIDEKVEEILNYLSKAKKNSYISQIDIIYAEELDKEMESTSKEKKDLWCEQLMDELSDGNPYMVVFWYSMLVFVNKDGKLFNRYAQYILDNNHFFPIETRYFLFYQLKAAMFMHKIYETKESQILVWKLILDIIEEYQKILEVDLSYIPKEQRNDNLYLVITEQMLVEQHGPTKTALDRCKVIMDKLGKEVLLIDTAEILSMVGRIPIYRSNQSNYNEDLLEVDTIPWKGANVPYYQCENNMPNIGELNKLLSIIRSFSPARIVSIGGSSVLSGLANKMVPVVSIGLCPSDFEYTASTFQTLGRKLDDKDRFILDKLMLPQTHVIESIFTSSLKPQTEHISRADMQIDDNAFAMCVVGGRLDVEVSDEFLNMLEELIISAPDEKLDANVPGGTTDETMDAIVPDTPDIQIVFLGRFDTYDRMVSKYPAVKEHSKFLGFCDDILSRMEHIDLYVNPIRKGGGTSCVEAMSKGVPVVTVNYGDVSVNVGDAFCVESYDEMKTTIIKYMTDKSFYAKMSACAIKRTEILLDTEGAFVKILEEADAREK